MAWQDTDQWWRERRVLARKLLDLSDVRTAYQIVRDAAPPADEYYRAEAHFMEVDRIALYERACGRARSLCPYR